MTVLSKDISFVIQGLVNKTSISEVIHSVRRNFPDSEVILSTWKGCELDVSIKSIIDVLIENDDPGDFTYPEDTSINVNRQLVSSRNGIEKATRKYVVKTRTDIVFNNSKLLEQLARQYSRSEKYKVGIDYILVSDFSTRSHLKGIKVPFWVCDFIYAGLRQDLIKLFSLKDYPLDYFYCFKDKHPENYQDKKHIYKYTPETYITYNYLDKSREVVFEHSYDNNTKAMDYYHNYLLNNFVILNKRQLGVKSTKYYLPFSSRHIMFTNTDWKIARNEFSLFSKDSVLDFFEFIEWLYIKLLNKRVKR